MPKSPSLPERKGAKTSVASLTPPIEARIESEDTTAKANTAEPRAKLEAMHVDERVAAVAEDLESRRDEYRSIEPYVLADLLGVPFADKPDGHWDRISFIPRPSICDCFKLSDGYYTWPESLELHVTTDRLSELKKKLRALRKRMKLQDLDFEFMTNSEKEVVINGYMENEFRSARSCSSVSPIHD